MYSKCICKNNNYYICNVIYNIPVVNVDVTIFTLGDGWKPIFNESFTDYKKKKKIWKVYARDGSRIHPKQFKKHYKVDNQSN